MSGLISISPPPLTSSCVHSLKGPKARTYHWHVHASFTLRGHTAGKKQVWIGSSPLWRQAYACDWMSAFSGPKTSNWQATVFLQLSTRNPPEAHLSRLMQPRPLYAPILVSFPSRFTCTDDTQRIYITKIIYNPLLEWKAQALWSTFHSTLYTIYWYKTHRIKHREQVSRPVRLVLMLWLKQMIMIQKERNKLLVQLLYF